MSSDSGSSSDIDAVVIDRDDISNYNPEQILPESPECIQQIRKWLQPTSYDHESGEYRKHLASHFAGTGAWVTSSTTYQTWLHSDECGMLWIKGIPGSGKSVLASKLIDEISRSRPGIPVLYFFFRQIIDANHEPTALLRDWLDQILLYSPPLQRQLKAYKESNRSISSMSMEDLWRDLRMAFSGLPDKVYCVADALDEMDQGNDSFIKALGALGEWKPNKVKVLITSRPVPSVEIPLRMAKCLQIRLEEKMVDRDISSFVQHGLHTSSITPEDQKLIIEAVPGRANGLFLYAKLAMDAFLEPGANIKEVLFELPTDLNSLYTSLLHDHAERSGVPDDIQLLILQWVTHATRPLRLLEIAEMIIVTYRNESCEDLKATKDLVRAACGPLLEILPDETVCVVHHSLTEYLKGSTRPGDETGYPILQLGSTHAQLGIACLAYMQSGCLDQVEVKKETSVDPGRILSSRRNNSDLDCIPVKYKLKYPFLEYAVNNWKIHIARSTATGYDQTNVNTALDGFFQNSRHMDAWLKFGWGSDVISIIGVTKLHIASRSGLLQYVKHLLAFSGSEVDAVDIRGKSSLWWAARSGHAEIITILIEAGADPNKDDKVYGLKPLHKAAENNHFAASEALLKAGVDPLTEKTREDPGRRCGNVSRTTGETPLLVSHL
jgi:Ankyrin repeats (3 copies)/NACHT domain